MKITHKPFWIAFNVWVSLVILLGGYLLGTLHKPDLSWYCEGKQCTRVLPNEDKEAVMLEQILLERHYAN